MRDTSTDHPTKLINLMRGWPNHSMLPIAAIARASQVSLSDPSISIPGLSYGPDPGYQPLREEIATWLTGFYSPSLDVRPGTADPDRICISGGASQNLACVLQVFSDPLKTTIWMVAPCYYLACRMFEDAGLRPRAVGEGKDGIDLEALEKGMREVERQAGDVKPNKPSQTYSKIYRHFIYLVPTFSNPSGKTMPLSTRESLVRLARKHDALIITDDVYDFIKWPTASFPSGKSSALLPRLVDVDRTLEPVPSAEEFGNAISNGSFSKISGPGVRTGWAEATPKFIYALSQTGSSRSGGAPSQLVATMMAQLLKSGDLSNHISNVLIPAYKARYEIIIEAVRRELFPLGAKLGEVNFEEKNVFGGYFIWVELPQEINAEKLAEIAKEEQNLIIAPGTLFEVLGDKSVKFSNSFRLCFAYEEQSDIVEGINRLGKAIKECKLVYRNNNEKIAKLGEFSGT